MTGPLVADLGFGTEVWIYLCLLSSLVLFFKFGRIWSIRNLDLVLLFAPAPGLLRLVGSGGEQPWWPFLWLFVGSGLWLVRSLLDLGLSRRPLLEPNLNTGGLACLLFGLLGLLLIEVATLTPGEGRLRNPAEPHAEPLGPLPPAEPDAPGPERTLQQVLRQVPTPAVLKRLLAGAAHTGLTAGLFAVGWQVFGRATLGLAMAVSYLLMPYTRIALLDPGQLLASALIVGAVLAYRRPGLAGVLIGLTAGWMPAALGLIPLWAGFYSGGRGLGRFLGFGLAVLVPCGLLAQWLSNLAGWARALGARSLAEAGLIPGVLQDPAAGSFWNGVDPVYRLPVLIAYVALVLVVSVVPVQKDLGQLIALSAMLLIASQFWYLDEGGTLVLLYLPLVLLMIFRPNLTSRRPPLRSVAATASVPTSLG